MHVAYVKEKQEIMADRPQKVYSSILVKVVNGFYHVWKRIHQMVEYSKLRHGFKKVWLHYACQIGKWFLIPWFHAPYEFVYLPPYLYPLVPDCCYSCASYRIS